MATEVLGTLTIEIKRIIGSDEFPQGFTKPTTSMLNLKHVYYFKIRFYQKYCQNSFR